MQVRNFDDDHRDGHLDGECPKKVVDTMYPLVMDAIRNINCGLGAKVKHIFCYIRQHCDVLLEDGDLSCAIRGSLTKGMCKKEIKKTPLGEYRMAYGCHKGKCLAEQEDQVVEMPRRGGSGSSCRRKMAEPPRKKAEKPQKHVPPKCQNPKCLRR